jgi:hypothetical protein
MNFPSSHLPVKIVLPIMFRAGARGGISGLLYASLCRREITSDSENRDAQQEARPDTLQYTHSLPHF